MSDPSTVINEEAAAWVVRLNSDQRTRADLESFRQWLERGGEHRSAYADNAALWVGVGLLAENEEARAILRRPTAGPRRGALLGRRQALFGGIGLAAAAAVAGLVVSPMLGAQSYATGVGEQKHIALADGSTVLLDTDSALRVHLTSGERRLFLDRGQAFFRVAKDRNRPFRVFAGGDEVRAIGTAFDVRRLDAGTRVTLEEGRVGIYRVAGEGTRMTQQRTATLTPGEQATLKPEAAPVVRPADLRRSQAWRSGRIILDDDSLAEAAAELNRYGGPRIVLADRACGEVRVSGVFHTGEPAAFAESIAAAFPVVVVRQDSQEIVLARRA